MGLSPLLTTKQGICPGFCYQLSDCLDISYTFLGKSCDSRNFISQILPESLSPTPTLFLSTRKYFADNQVIPQTNLPPPPPQYFTYWNFLLRSWPSQKHKSYFWSPPLPHLPTFSLTKYQYFYIPDALGILPFYARCKPHGPHKIPSDASFLPMVPTASQPPTNHLTLKCQAHRRVNHLQAQSLGSLPLPDLVEHQTVDSGIWHLTMMPCCRGYNPTQYCIVLTLRGVKTEQEGSRQINLPSFISSWVTSRHRFSSCAVWRSLTVWTPHLPIDLLCPFIAYWKW